MAINMEQMQKENAIVSHIQHQDWHRLDSYLAHEGQQLKRIKGFLQKPFIAMACQHYSGFQWKALESCLNRMVNIGFFMRKENAVPIEQALSLNDFRLLQWSEQHGLTTVESHILQCLKSYWSPSHGGSPIPLDVLFMTYNKIKTHDKDLSYIPYFIAALDAIKNNNLDTRYCDMEQRDFLTGLTQAFLSWNLSKLTANDGDDEYLLTLESLSPIIKKDIHLARVKDIAKKLSHENANILNSFCNSEQARIQKETLDANTPISLKESTVRRV